MTDDMNAATRWRHLEQMKKLENKLEKFFRVETVFVVPMRGSADGYECEVVRVRGNQIVFDGPLHYQAPGSSLPQTTVVPASALDVECRVALVAAGVEGEGQISPGALRALHRRVVRVHAAAEIPPVPEVTIVVSGSFPRAAADDLSWPARHMERFRSDADAIADALSGTLPGGTLDRLTSVLLARKASQLVVRSAPTPDPAPYPPSQVPVPMLLHCPKCGARHVDEGEFATKIHHTHACQSCGMCWRPAVVATTGVRFLPGFRNEDPAAPGTITAGSSRDEHGHMRDEHGCIRCPKCGAGSGDDWSQCRGACPMPGSPHHRSCENGNDDPGDRQHEGVTT
jgi:hypothetical protein